MNVNETLETARTLRMSKSISVKGTQESFGIELKAWQPSLAAILECLKLATLLNTNANTQCQLNPKEEMVILQRTGESLKKNVTSSNSFEPIWETLHHGETKFHVNIFS